MYSIQLETISIFKIFTNAFLWHFHDIHLIRRTLRVLRTEKPRFNENVEDRVAKLSFRVISSLSHLIVFSKKQ